MGLSPARTLLCALALVAGTASAGDTPLRVMLQGSSSDQLAQLVEQHGGTVTHRLHIINAVGALVSREQLDAMLMSPLITRHIDDLSLSPPEHETPNCMPGGALELQLAGREVRWPIFNKGASPLTPQSFKLAWPARLGKLQSVRLDDRPLRRKTPTPPGESSATLDLEPGSEARIDQSATLHLQFEHSTSEVAPLQQREFNLSAHFEGGCETELIPGYETYGTDTYYPSVAGAAALHQHGITGRGVTVAVLDSGLWEDARLSRDTQGRYRVRGHYDAIRDLESKEVFDESGHGTHMTSVLAHSGLVTRPGAPAGSYMGIAPDVDLVAVKAFNKTGQGDFLDIVRGIQWIVDHREVLDIRVLNLSFAARPRWPYWLDPINQAVMRAWQAGIVVVAAAGNEGPDAMTIGSPGNLPYIITVGAITDSWTPLDRNDDYLPDFSSRGPTPSAHIKPDVLAPGGHIAGITRPGSTLTREHPDYVLSTGEFVMTGTSQASALVSGIAALLLQLEPDLTPDDVKCKLISSAELAINHDGLLAYSPFQQGNGLVNASRAVTLGRRGCGNPQLDLAKDIANEQHYEGPAIIDDNGTTSLPGLNNLYSGEPSAKGHSDTRRWGVKAHIERQGGPTPTTDAPVDWLQQYLDEKTMIDSLARQSPE